MDKKATVFWKLLEGCETMEDVFYIQPVPEDALSDEEILELRAERISLSVEDVRAYQNALNTIKSIEAKYSSH